MARKTAKSGILLDWFNVSYRTVVLGGILIAGLVAALAFYFFVWRTGPREVALNAIRRAEIRFEEALEYESEERFGESIASARAALDEARSFFAGREYPNASSAAERSESLSLRVLQMARGGDIGPGRDVRFYRIEGDVKFKRRGEFAWTPADKTTTLQVGDQVKTSSSASAQIIYFDGTVTTIQPGSLLEIKELYENEVTKVRKVREKLNWGELMASTQPRNVEGSYHEVATDSVAAKATEQGEFRVAFDRAGKTSAFDVFEGRVEVAGPGRKEMIAAGERVRATADGRLASKEVLPGVARLISPRDQRVFVHDDPSTATTRLSWESVPGAARYHLMISDQFLFTDPLYDAERRETSVVIDGITQGSYFWRVAAVSRSGVEGPFSETRRFRVTTQKIRDTGDTTPPELEITDVVQTGPMLIINGKTEPGAQVWIGNEKVDVSEDGSFYTVVRLRKEGVNELIVMAQDAAGNERVIKHRAYVETY